MIFNAIDGASAIGIHIGNTNTTFLVRLNAFAGSYIIKDSAAHGMHMA